MKDPRLQWFYDQMAVLSSVVFSHPAPNEYLASLPESKRCLFYVGCFLTQVDNGGVWEYLLGSCWDDSGHAIHFLKTIGETEIADGFSELCDKLPDEILSSYQGGRDHREGILFGLGLNDDFERLGETIWKRSDDVRRILADYCQADWG